MTSKTNIRRILDKFGSRFFPNACNTAEKAAESMLFHDKGWLVVMGLTQAGKSEFLLCLGELTWQYIKEVGGQLQTNVKFAIITGMNTADYPEQIDGDYKKTGCTFPKHFYKNNAIKKAIKQPTSKLPHDIKQFIKDLMDPNTIVYVFVDESLYGIEPGSILSQLFRDKLGLDFGSDEDTEIKKTNIEEELRRLNIRLVTISATPYGEMLRLVNRTTNECVPEIILHHPGNGYYGLENALRDCCVYDNTTISNGIIKPIPLMENGQFTSVFEQALDNYDKFCISQNSGKVILARVPSGKKKSFGRTQIEELKKLFEARYGEGHVNIETLGQDGDFTSIHKKSGGTIFDARVYLGDVRVVLIWDMLRLAIRVPMSNIGLVWDYTSTANDVVIQSLPGRRTGYDCSLPIPIYTHLESVKSYVEMWTELKAIEGDQEKMREVMNNFLKNNSTSKSSKVKNHKSNLFSVVTVVQLPKEKVAEYRLFHDKEWNDAEGRQRSKRFKELIAAYVPTYFLEGSMLHRERGATQYHVRTYRELVKGPSLGRLHKEDRKQYEMLDTSKVYPKANTLSHTQTTKRILVSQDYCTVYIAQILDEVTAAKYHNPPSSIKSKDTVWHPKKRQSK